MGADSPEHVLPCFEDDEQPDDVRLLPQSNWRAWVRTQVTMTASRSQRPTGCQRRSQNLAAPPATPPLPPDKLLRRASPHELGAAAYAIKAVRCCRPVGRGSRPHAMLWRRARLQLLSATSGLDDQKLRSPY